MLDKRLKIQGWDLRASISIITLRYHKINIGPLYHQPGQIPLTALYLNGRQFPRMGWYPTGATFNLNFNFKQQSYKNCESVLFVKFHASPIFFILVFFICVLLRLCDYFYCKKIAKITGISTSLKSDSSHFLRGRSSLVRPGGITN